VSQDPNQKGEMNMLHTETARNIWRAMLQELPESAPTARVLAKFAGRLEQSTSRQTMPEEKIETETQRLEPIAQKWLAEQEGRP
jgi:hypothetical protein